MVKFEQPLAARSCSALPLPTHQRKKQRIALKKKDQIKRTLSPPLTTDISVYLLIDDDPHAPSSPDHERQRTPSKYPISWYATRLHAPDSER